ncbi:ABC transporter ATP-binding protein [Vallitalea okinawensis]|uniref:ABC transporter ATP-binding protein n=1 Tax=Vallitalea okinawensis TaxID=2078660 RepID=UPI000CFB9442|nr:ABC transporter ATP-binding protein [Vallitalea okinawensis]
MKNIIINNINKSFGKKQVLQNISLEINEGMFGLLGHNGAGKTTLMRILTTLLNPDQGQVYINGLDAHKNRKAIKEKIGFMPQEFSLYKELTALEMIDYIASLNGLNDKKQRCKKIMDTLEQVNLIDVKDQKIGGFSGGMKRRLGIALSVVKNPEILIVDEPTAGLDPEERVRFRTMLVEFSQNRIVILSTHIVEDISASCEQLALLDAGQLAFSGTPRGWLNQVSGQVYEIEAYNRKELLQLKDNYPIISMRQSNEAVILRLLADYHHVLPKMVQVAPNLEDAYLHFCRKKQCC